jgi:prolipoprotein diacylglyceryltransferase
MLQVLFRIPIVTSWTPDGIPVYGFGMMLFVAFLACTWLAGRRAEREGVSRDAIQDLAIWIFLGGLLGARVTYLLKEQPYTGLSDFLAQLPRIWEGGIVLYGAVLGGLAAYLVAYWLTFRRRGYATLQMGDIIAPAIALGIGLGRFGCFLNGCCYGQVVCTCCVYPVHFPLSAPPRYALDEAGYQTAADFTFDPTYQDAGARVGQVQPGSAAERAGLKAQDVITRADGLPVHKAEDLSAYLGKFGLWPRGKNDLSLGIATASQAPNRSSPIQETLDFRPRTIGLHPTQLYETISMGLLFLVLSAYYPLRTRRGQVLAILMMGYAVHRYLNELLRGDPRPVEFEWVSSVVLFGAGALLLIVLAFRPPDFRLTTPGGDTVTR